MQTKMTFGGIGPKLALITMPYLLLAILIMVRDPQFLKMNLPDHALSKFIGNCWICVGAIFYLATIVVFLSDFRKGLLVTRGTFGLCRNPIYASVILFFVPGLALVFESGMILSIAFVLYLNFKISIHGERLVLQRNFGQAYEQYERTVNEIVPIPRFWTRNIADKNCAKSPVQ